MLDEDLIEGIARSIIEISDFRDEKTIIIHNFVFRDMELESYMLQHFIHSFEDRTIV